MIMIETKQMICWVAAFVGVAGCGTSPPDSNSPKASSISAINRQVTFHLPKMCERLRLL